MSAHREHWTTYESPIGSLTLVAGAAGLRSVGFPGRVRVAGRAIARALPELSAQLDAYFAGELQVFDFEELAVWRGLLEIPYGETRSYGQQAGAIEPALFAEGVEPWQRARLVGRCNGRNPLAVIVPCHRVIGADGSLTGYGGGIWRKRALLELEGSASVADHASAATRQLAMF